MEFESRLIVFAENTDLFIIRQRSYRTRHNRFFRSRNLFSELAGLGDVFDECDTLRVIHHTHLVIPLPARIVGCVYSSKIARYSSR